MDIDQILRAIARPEIVAIASTVGAGITWLVMGYLTTVMPDKLWQPLAALTGIIATIMGAAAKHELLDVGDLAGCVLAGAVAGVVTLSVGHRKPKDTIKAAVAEGALKPEAVEPKALPTVITGTGTGD